jgi:hypothetical protein
MKLCDLCSQPVLLLDGTTVHIELDGKTFAFTYHNTLEKSCLRTYLCNLQTMYEMSAQSH